MTKLPYVDKDYPYRDRIEDETGHEPLVLKDIPQKKEKVTIHGWSPVFNTGPGSHRISYMSFETKEQAAQFGKDMDYFDQRYVGVKQVHFTYWPK